MQYIKPNWPAPENVKAFSTTRQKGISQPPYSSFNLAFHVGDQEENVSENRAILKKSLALPSEPLWLQQVHSNQVIKINTFNSPKATPIADACITTLTGIVCTVMTADCLPILLCNHSGTLVAAIHAGWKGLASGVIENTLREIEIADDHSELMAWLGPAIGPNAFEVSEDVFNAFVANDPSDSCGFQEHPTLKNKWLANIYTLATKRLNENGITSVYSENYCTYTEDTLFYSYRRDRVTGRMASLIWLSA